MKALSFTRISGACDWAARPQATVMARAALQSSPADHGDQGDLGTADHTAARETVGGGNQLAPVTRSRVPMPPLSESALSGSDAAAQAARTFRALPCALGVMDDPHGGRGPDVRNRIPRGGASAASPLVSLAPTGLLCRLCARRPSWERGLCVRCVDMEDDE